MRALKQWYANRCQLKIRGKLILSFGIAMVVLLSALGSITYFTFKDSISSSTTRIAELTLQNHKLIFNRFFDNLRNDLESSIHSLESEQLLLDQASSKQAFTTLLESNPYYSENVVSFEGELPPGTISHPSKSELETASHENAHLLGVDFLEGNNNTIWLHGTSKLKNSQSADVYFQLDMQKIWSAILKISNGMDNSILFVSTGAKVILANINSTANGSTPLYKELNAVLSDSEKMISIIHTLSRSGANTQEISNLHIVRSELGLLDWEMYSITPGSVFMADLVELKNRIISATIITFWISLWIVLIVAHRISKPIISLSEATLDIQQHDYSTPLAFGSRKDEIGELANSFETMRQHIEKLVFTDTLTGVLNRRYLLNAMQSLVAETLRADDNMAFIMIDLDHFKAINDTHGHGAGDEVLKAVARAIASSIREYDIAARYGGEEFCVVLPRTMKPENALVVSEKIRSAVEKLLVQYDNKSLTATCSLGIAHLKGVTDYQSLGKNEIINTLMSDADLALYDAKSRGRNRSVLYHPNISSSKAA